MLGVERIYNSAGYTWAHAYPANNGIAPVICCNQPMTHTAQYVSLESTYQRHASVVTAHGLCEWLFQAVNPRKVDSRTGVGKGPHGPTFRSALAIPC